jgi:ribulose-bisphosphate carboxylase small chain
MRLTQGTFSFLPDFTHAQIRAQIEYALRNGWAVSLEHTDDAHPRSTYWEMFGAPMFDFTDATRIMEAVEQCRRSHPGHYVKVNAFDATSGWESLRLSFIVNRPREEQRFRLVREESAGRIVRYTVQPDTGAGRTAS